jgi:hypothetical protein
LLVFGDKLAETDDRQLIAFCEAIAVGFDECNLRPVDALFLDPREKLVRRPFVLANEFVPGGDFVVKPRDVFERIVGRYRTVEDP